MHNIEPRLADSLGVLTPQTKTARVLQPRQQLTVDPPFTPDYAPNGSVTDPGLRAEIAHGRNCARIFQNFKHVLDVSGHLNSASQHGVINFDLAKSRPLITPREIAGAGNWCASGHAHQSKAVR